MKFKASIFELTNVFLYMNEIMATKTTIMDKRIKTMMTVSFPSFWSSSTTGQRSSSGLKNCIKIKKDKENSDWKRKKINCRQPFTSEFGLLLCHSKTGLSWMLSVAGGTLNCSHVISQWVYYSSPARLPYIIIYKCSLGSQ